MEWISLSILIFEPAGGSAIILISRTSNPTIHFLTRAWWDTSQYEGSTNSKDNSLITSFRLTYRVLDLFHTYLRMEAI